jgi:NitT/TauT family transport system substrate-binding protein
MTKTVIVAMKPTPSASALQANIDLQHKLGFVKAPLDVKKYADFSVANEAAQRLAAG